MIKAVKGMNDILPHAGETFLDAAVWQFIEKAAIDVLESFGYRHVRLPIVEETSLFARGIGADTDIVQKEMYTFTDRGERSLTLRPEGTAGVVRAYLEHGFCKTDPIQRYWYLGPMFRAEAPQKGRYRQFYQIGAEFLGVKTALADAELLILLHHFCTRLGLSDIKVKLNSLGDPESRSRYREVLTGYFNAKTNLLCESCQRRLLTNPLRVLDCKRPACREVAAAAPLLPDAWSEEARKHFDRVRDLAEKAGVPVQSDPRLVRGLDYYTSTLFEFSTSALGAQDAILGGGRYDDLVEELGGPSIPAIGFAAGIERLALLVSERVLHGSRTPWDGPHLYIIPMPGQESHALALAAEIRQESPLTIEVDVSEGRLKQQMRRADRIGALAALVLGEDEIVSGVAALKNLRQSTMGVPEAKTEAKVLLNGKSLSIALGKLSRESYRVGTGD